MDGQTEAQVQDIPSNDSLDPWAQAFASLEQEDEKADDAASTVPGGEQNAGNVPGDVSDTNDADEGEGSSNAQGDNSSVDKDVDGGSGAEPDADRGEDDRATEDMLSVSEEDIKSFRSGLERDVRDRAIDAVAKEFIKRGIRNTNGKLGATIYDKDICKRDEDGVPRFYNPDTGREFTGDNPRRQAQEWVDDYNQELATAFNNACNNYEKKLMEDEAPQIAMLEFASTYDSLDPVRQSMFESIVEDYEITDSNGDVIGYSCDLNKALAAVNRQIEAIQSFAKNSTSVQQAKSGPVLDMKNSAGAAVKPEDKPEPKSLAEALEIEQNKLLEKMRKGK